MKVLINAASAHMGGAFTYLTNLLLTIPKIAPDLEMIVCLPEATRSQLEKLQLDSTIKLLTYPFAATDGGQRVYFDQILVRKLVKQHQIDVVFSSTGFATFVCPCPQLLLIRNPIYFDKYFHQKYESLGHSLLTNKLRRWWSLISIQRSNITLFPTFAMRQMVAEYMEFPPHKTSVIHYGFDEAAFRTKAPLYHPVVAQIQQWKQQGYVILLNVSAYAVHKNFETVLEALPLLASQGIRVKFIATISRDKTTDKQEYDLLMRHRQQLFLEETFIVAGYIPYQQLASIYGAADLFIFPSLTESFGHPMVEAMSIGLPVIASDTSINREICQDAGVYFPPLDNQACAEAINMLLSDQEKFKCLQAKATQRGTAFSWENYARDFVKLLQTMV